MDVLCRFSFYRDGLRFLGVLALFGVAGIIYTFVVLYERGAIARKMVLRALDLVTTVSFDPALTLLRPCSVWCARAPGHCLTFTVPAPCRLYRPPCRQP
jgi:hypothetical protein